MLTLNYYLKDFTKDDNNKAMNMTIQCFVVVVVVVVVVAAVAAVAVVVVVVVAVVVVGDAVA